MHPYSCVYLYFYAAILMKQYFNIILCTLVTKYKVILNFNFSHAIYPVGHSATLKSKHYNMRIDLSIGGEAMTGLHTDRIYFYANIRIIMRQLIINNQNTQIKK